MGRVLGAGGSQPPAIAPASRSGGSRSIASIICGLSTVIRIRATIGFSPMVSVTFLDFGLVKRWAPGEWEHLAPTLDAVIVRRDVSLLMTEMERSGFLVADHGLDPAAGLRLRLHALCSVSHAIPSPLAVNG